MEHELEARMIAEMIDVAFGAGEEIVGAQYPMAVGQQAIDQMRVKKSGSAGHLGKLGKQPMKLTLASGTDAYGSTIAHLTAQYTFVIDIPFVNTFDID